MSAEKRRREESSEGAEDEAEKVVVGEKRKATQKLEGETEVKGTPLKMKIGSKNTKTAMSSGISIKVGSMKSAEMEKKKANIISKPKKGSVAAAFNDESDEEEEIPREAKMRMRNLGKDTATSSGPNSFNKGKQGFTNYGKLFEKEMKLVKK